MGFYVEPTCYRIKFADPKYAGLEIMAESMDVGLLTELMSFSSFGDLAKDVREGKEIKLMTDAIIRMLDTFADKLVSWNIEDKHGNSIPANKEGVYKQDLSFIMMVIMNWMSNISSVDSPLSPDLSSGETSLMQSLTMEPL